MDIRVRHIEDFVAHQRTRAVQNRFDRNGKRKIGLSRSTVFNHVSYLLATYAFAQRREEVETNPVAGAAKPKAVTGGRQAGGDLLLSQAAELALGLEDVAEVDADKSAAHLGGTVQPFGPPILCPAFSVKSGSVRD